MDAIVCSPWGTEQRLAGTPDGLTHALCSLTTAFLQRVPPSPPSPPPTGTLPSKLSTPKYIIEL